MWSDIVGRKSKVLFIKFVTAVVKMAIYKMALNGRRSSIIVV